MSHELCNANANFPFEFPFELPFELSDIIVSI